MLCFLLVIIKNKTITKKVESSMDMTLKQTMILAESNQLLISEASQGYIIKWLC